MLSTHRLVDRMRAEYDAMPGLKLSLEQACRLWSVDDEHCNAAFDTLLAEGFLHRTGTGKYVALPRPGGAAAASETGSEGALSQVRCPNCFKLNSIQHDDRALAHGVAMSFRCTACKRIVTVSAVSA